MPTNIFTVSGTVLSEQTHQPLKGLKVEAWDKDLVKDDFLGTYITNELGKFSMRFARSDFKELLVDGKSDVYFKM